MNIKCAFLTAMLMFTQLPVLAQSIASKVENQGTPRYVQVTGLTAREQNGLLSLHIEFTNSDSDDQAAYYRISWLDETGFPVWNEEAWKPILVHGKAKEKLLVAAPTTRARDFKVQFSAQKNWASTDSPQQ